MSNDDYIIHPRFFHTPYRRRRSVLGKDWVPPKMQDTHAGVWCPNCRRRHPYNGKDKLISQYEKRGEVFVILWCCPLGGHVIGEHIIVRSDEEEGGEHATPPVL